MRKDGTVSYEGRFFEVPYELVGKMVQITVDPHGKRVSGGSRMRAVSRSGPQRPSMRSPIAIASATRRQRLGKLPSRPR